MKKLMLAVSAFVALVAAAPGYAQFTGPTVIDQVRNDFNRQERYSVEKSKGTIVLRDASTGEELFTLSEVDAQTVTLSSVIAKLDHLSPERKHEVLQRIAFFNFSSPVGTLGYDNSTGTVTMEHHLNPRQVSASSIATVAVRFGDVARAEANNLAQ